MEKFELHVNVKQCDFEHYDKSQEKLFNSFGATSRCERLLVLSVNAVSRCERLFDKIKTPSL